MKIPGPEPGTNCEPTIGLVIPLLPNPLEMGILSDMADNGNLVLVLRMRTRKCELTCQQLTFIVVQRYEFNVSLSASDVTSARSPIFNTEVVGFTWLRREM